MSDRQIVHLVVGPVQTNCYLVMNQKTKETIIVDPGAEADRIVSALTKMQAKPVAILLTHGHFDHARGGSKFGRKVRPFGLCP